MLQEIVELLGSRNWAYRDPPNLVALGQARCCWGMIRAGFWTNSLTWPKANPDYREAYLAAANWR
jgi:hypothetical protein